VQPRTLAFGFALLAGVVAADIVMSRRTATRLVGGAPAADCFGHDSIVDIAPGRIGALTLDLPIGELRRRCPNMGWTTTNGDETLDTAVLITRPGLRVVGIVATLVDDGGDHRPVRIDSSRRIVIWKISGTRGALPDGVPLTATWNDLRRAYGPLGAFALNGTVYVTICRRPGIGVLMDLAHPEAPINPVNGEAQEPAAIDSLMAGTPIAEVEVRSISQAGTTSSCSG
jgi:hypothetical protein